MSNATIIPRLLTGSAMLFLAASPLSATVIALPDGTYTGSTTLIPIIGRDSSTATTLADGTLTVTFSNTMTVGTVPASWNTWNSPPNAETSTPRVLSNVDISTLSLSLSQGVTTFGFEVEPGLGVVPFTVQFLNGKTVLDTITLTLSSASGSALFAVSESTPIDNVIITDGGGIGFAVAQVRYASVPEPSSVLFLSSGLAAMLYLRRRRVSTHLRHSEA